MLLVSVWQINAENKTELMQIHIYIFFFNQLINIKFKDLNLISKNGDLFTVKKRISGKQETNSKPP